MKLGLISGYGIQIPPRRYGASEEVMWQIAKRLSNDIEIDIYSRSDYLIKKYPNVKNIRFNYLNRPIDIVDNLFFDNTIYKKFITNDIRKKDMNILHNNNPHFTELLNFKNSKIIFQAHNAPGGGYNIDTLNASLKQKALKMLNESDKILCVSNYVKKALSSYADINKFKVIYNGVDTSEFKPLKKENIILCSGKIQPEKGQIYLLKAFSEIKTDWKLYFTGFCSKPPYGDLEYCKNCYKYASDNIKFFGFLPRRDLIDLYGRARIFVCPSVWQEAFGLVNVEALSSGCAMIASNGGGIPEIVTNNKTGFIVQPSDPAEIHEKLLLLMQNEELLNKISNRAREEAINRFDWDVISKQYLEFYRSLAQT